MKLNKTKKTSIKIYSLLLFLLTIQYSWGQVGIKTTDPKAQLDINASNQLTPANTDGILIPRIDDFPVIDPTADQNGMLVFLTTDNTFYSWNWKSGTGRWVSVINSDDTDNVKTKIIRQIGGGENTEVTIFSNITGITVKFDPSSETVTVSNTTGDSTHYWDIVIEGDSRTASGSSTGSDRYVKNFIVNNESVIYDLGNIDSGWFNIVAANQNFSKKGFILHVIYYSDDLNGLVQYWDN